MTIRVRNLSPTTTIYTIWKKLIVIGIEPRGLRTAGPSEVLVDVSRADGRLLVLSWHRRWLDGNVLDVKPESDESLTSATTAVFIRRFTNRDGCP